ncbi:DUF6694 family lipoprotein [uncultured Gilliamella sp.]|jgi:hypothetical protein|uniref:DUF6694 family lipoprotein n=1 Tax=uncultured Gilliamella sp. TaxID=1193505 RepID=UPI0025E82DEC|nr:DUF6694 family lipoprotein [uncultured Gilliamella sp.]
MKKLIIILISVMLLTACGEKKIDASTTESFKKSVEEISKSLNEADQIAFQQAIVKITMVTALKTQGDNVKFEEIFKEKFNGKTVAEVIEIAEKENNPQISWEN